MVRPPRTLTEATALTCAREDLYELQIKIDTGQISPNDGDLDRWDILEGYGVTEVEVRGYARYATIFYNDRMFKQGEAAFSLRVDDEMLPRDSVAIGMLGHNGEGTLFLTDELLALGCCQLSDIKIIALAAVGLIYHQWQPCDGDPYCLQPVYVPPVR